MIQDYRVTQNYVNNLPAILGENGIIGIPPDDRILSHSKLAQK